MKVVVFQWPCGTPMRRRSPRGQRPWRRAMLVVAQVSSMKTSRVGIEIELALEPGLPPLQDVGAVLLAGMRRSFFARDAVAAEEAPQRPVAEVMAASASAARSSSMVASGVAANSARISGACASIRPERRSPPAARAARRPAPLQRPPPAHARRAHPEARRRLPMAHPPRTAARTRVLRSSESAFDMPAGLRSRQTLESEHAALGNPQRFHQMGLRSSEAGRGDVRGGKSAGAIFDSRMPKSWQRDEGPRVDPARARDSAAPASGATAISREFNGLRPRECWTPVPVPPPTSRHNPFSARSRRPNFLVVFEGCSGEAPHCAHADTAEIRSLRADILRTC